MNEIISDLSMEELLSHVKNFVTRNYDLKPLEVALIEDGIASLNFHVKTEAVSFIIRCDQRRSHQIVKSDEDYILAAKANGVEVPPLPILVEEFFGTAISGRCAIPGMTLSQVLYDLEIIREAGRQLGLIHTATSPSSRVERKFFYNFVFDHNDTRWTEFQEFAFNHPDYSIREISKRLATEIHDGIRLQDDSEIGSGLVHGDYTFSNLLTDNDGQLFVLDWEKSCEASTIYDLSLGLFYLVCGGRSFRPDIVPIFLQGYLDTGASSRKALRLLSPSMDVAAKAFFLTDVNYVAKDILSVGVSTRSRRQNFFTSFCLPAYQTYTDNVGIITEAINRYLLSFA